MSDPVPPPATGGTVGARWPVPHAWHVLRLVVGPVATLRADDESAGAMTEAERAAALDRRRAVQARVAAFCQQGVHHEEVPLAWEALAFLERTLGKDHPTSRDRATVRPRNGRLRRRSSPGGKAPCAGFCSWSSCSP